MSRLRDLIEKLCPDGVEYKRLGEVLNYEQPTKYIVQSTDYVEKGVPVLTAGQTFILGYTEEAEGIFKASTDNPVIIFDDFTTSFHWVDFDFKVKSSAMKMLRPFPEADVVFRFVYYAMSCIKYETLEHSRQWISKYSDILIPIPPKEIQEEIVRILDKFTELEAELEAELDCRKRQYEHYRDKLLDFVKINGGGQAQIQWRRLEEVSDMQRGTMITQKDVKEKGDIPVVSGGTKPAYYCNMSNRTGETITVAGSGANAGYVAFWNIPIFVCDAFSIKAKEMCKTKYIYYWLLSKQNKISATKTGAGVPHVHINNVAKLEIPIPPLDEQARIVSILDRFEKLCTDICEGLPAEIAARRQQYEHYRDLLLDFKPLTA